MRGLAALLSLGFVAVLGAPAQAQDVVTWKREYVRLQEVAAAERVFGRRAAEKMRATPRIIGGTRAPAGRWKFLVGILDSNVPKNYFAQFCGGSLVHRRFVVTAAHCVEQENPDGSGIRVLAGTTSLRGTGNRYEVERIFVHPRYNRRTLDYDVAVIKLAKPVGGIDPVKLLAKSKESIFAEAGDLAFVAGWGDTSGFGDFTQVLREVQVPLVGRGLCRNNYAAEGEKITGRMICAGLAQGGKDSCQGDSGGPLIVRDRSGRWTLQAGVVSWGIGCAEAGLYGVYSRLAVLGSWASNKIRSRAAAKTQPEPDCDTVVASRRVACLEQAIAEAEEEIQSYVVHVSSEGSAAQVSGVKAAQSAWAGSLDTVCAFEAASKGDVGRKACRLAQMRKRAGDLAEQMASIAE